MEIDDLVKEAHETSVSKGWWDKDRNTGEALALMHSEISEALEEYRTGEPLNHISFVADGQGNQKPEGFLVELADEFIRIADFCGGHNLDLESALRLKLAYNKTRPYRHGGKIA